MSLTPGTRIGPYEVIGPLGAGGMGEVYRARDTKLGRDVAIKVLPDTGALDPDRTTRFAREAQALASLNHPNIAQIFGLEETPHGSAIAMELVEGRTLAEIIPFSEAGPLGPANSPGLKTRPPFGTGLALPDAWPIALQIAEALEAAHGAGIVHRDLKPGNIMVRPDGVVKVLDFGLARTLDAGPGTQDPSNSPTLTARATQMGIVLGTAAYMSPEQARGKSVDKRTDIWAFGCVVFEMLTGRQAFAGETVTDILAAVVKNEPDWNALPPDTPRALRTVLRRCLTKDVKLRLRDIGDGRLEMLEPEPMVATSAVATTAQPSRRWLIPAVFGALVIGAIGGVMWRASRDVPPVQWTGARLGGPAIALYPRVSPDGQLLAFQAMVDGLTQIAVMKPGTGNWTVLTRDRTKGLADALAWSSDGARIYFDRWTDVPLGIFSVPALGGDERLMIENASAPEPLPDGSLLLQRINADRQPQLHRFWPDTGKLEPLPVITFSAGYAGPVRRLDADHVAVMGRPLTDGAGQDELHVLTLSTGTMTRLGSGLTTDVFISMTVRRNDNAILMSVRDGSAYRVLEIRPDAPGPPKSLMTFLSRPHIDAGDDGALFLALLDRPAEIVHFREGSSAADRWLGGPTLFRYAVGLADGRFLVTERLDSIRHMLVGAPGKEPVRLVETSEDTRQPMTAVGADRVALIIGSGPTPDIGVVAVNSGRILKRLKAPANITSMDASPDGAVVYVSSGGTISAIPIDGSAPRTLGSGDSLTVDPDTGDLIVKLDEVNGFRLVRLSPRGGTPTPIVIDGPLKLVNEPLIAGAVRNGRLLLAVTTTDSWYWFPGVLDLRTGKLQKLALDYFTDFHYLTWAADGSIIGSAVEAESTLWKFTPQPGAASR